MHALGGPVAAPTVQPSVVDDILSDAQGDVRVKHDEVWAHDARGGKKKQRALQSQEGADASLAHKVPTAATHPPPSPQLNSPRSSAGTEEATSTGAAVGVTFRVRV